MVSPGPVDNLSPVLGRRCKHAVASLGAGGHAGVGGGAMSIGYVTQEWTRQSDFETCGAIQGTEYVTRNRCPNEYLLVWEPVRVGGEFRV
jgi:hypothetical protein